MGELTLIERLRAWSQYSYDKMHTEAGRALYADAADHITRLESDVEVLREALEPFANGDVDVSHTACITGGDASTHILIAREALSRIKGDAA